MNNPAPPQPAVDAITPRNISPAVLWTYWRRSYKSIPSLTYLALPLPYSLNIPTIHEVYNQTFKDKIHIERRTFYQCLSQLAKIGLIAITGSTNKRTAVRLPLTQETYESLRNIIYNQTGRDLPPVQP